MLCPLRKLVKSAAFEECYKEGCEWWVQDKRVEIGSGRCAIRFLGAFFSLSIKKEN